MEQNEQEKALALKYKEDYYVIQANELIRSKQDELSLMEAKLIRLAIAQILESDTDFKTYTCSVVDLAGYLDIPKGNIYREIDTLTTSILRKVIVLRSKEVDAKGKHPWKKFHWVSKAQYENGKITIRLSDEMTPYLLGLNELFTRYNYCEIVNLPTVYAIRLFELLASYQNMTFHKYLEKNYTGVSLEKNEIGFSIDYLRDYFNCEDKYPNTGDFVKRVIDAGVKAIRNKTIMMVSYRTVKKGRSITDIIFKLNDWGELPPPTPEMQRALDFIEQRKREGLDNG